MPPPAGPAPTLFSKGNVLKCTLLEEASMADLSDPLRTTLDTLELDPRAQADRPYLISMLRRLGYTESQIEEYLQARGMAKAPVAEPAPPAARSSNDGREYRLVIPAADSQFTLAASDAPVAPRQDSPFDDLERLEFQADGEQDLERLEFQAEGEQDLEFESVVLDETTFSATGAGDGEAGPALDEAAAEWTEGGTEGVEPLGEGETLMELIDEPEPAPEAKPETKKERKAREALEALEARGQAAREALERLDARERTARDAREQADAAETWEPVEAEPDSGELFNLGREQSPVAAPRTRVRMQRVRATSSEDASNKVAGEGRTILKSIPVDIVERWGAPEERRK